MVTQLPTIEVDGKTYFVDERLSELRNVDNPHDKLPLMDPEDVDEVPERFDGLS